MQQEMHLPKTRRSSGSRSKDESGKRYGRLVVVERAGKIGAEVAWKCQCDCGGSVITRGSSLRRTEGKGTRSCGCKYSDAQLIDLTGRRFGRWLVVERIKQGNRWLCRCDCGVTKSLAGAPLRDGSSTSCGCALRGGPSLHPLYSVWKGMLARCDQVKRNPSYVRYWGRGIRVCERWHVFENFLADMGERPPGEDVRGRAIWSLDRIDPNGDYEPGNVRWADSKTQTDNRALSEPRVSRVLDEMQSLIDDNEDVDPAAVISLVRRALLGV